MIYNDGVEMDERGRVRFCPRCKSEDHESDAEFCTICGLPRINYCMDEAHQYIHYNDSNARFCKLCGNPTVFSAAGLLKPYDVVMREGFTKPRLIEEDTTYDRYAEMSIVTGDQLLTAADMAEFGELISEEQLF